MKYKIYSVYDSAAEIYNTPMFCNHEKVAYRNFSDAANNPEHFIGRHPEDYILFYMGEFDDQTGEVQQDKITSCGNAVTFLKTEEPKS